MKHTPAPAYVATLETLNSRPDNAGNRYFAFVYTDHTTGRTARGTVCGGESNVRQILFELNGGSWEPRNVLTTARELPIREYNRTIKGWPYAGCTGPQLAAFVRAELAK